MSSSDTYIHGVRNIGGAELARRRSRAIAASVGTVALAVVLVVLDAHPVFFIALAIPATVAARSTIETLTQFCATYGRSGSSKFDGTRRTTSDPEHLAADRARAKRIAGQAVVAGNLVGFAAAAVALLA